MPTQFKRTWPTLCPFFAGMTKTEIKCKDTITGTGLAGESTVTCFKTPYDRSSHVSDFCSGCYRGCEVYIAFADKIDYEQ